MTKVTSLPPEQAEVVEWLRSPEGMRWSRRQNAGNCNMAWWFQLKPGTVALTLDERGDADDLDDVVAVDLGWYDSKADYHRSRPGYEGSPGYALYGKPAEASPQ